MVSILALVAAIPTVAGIAQAIAGAWLTRRFAAGAGRGGAPAGTPPVSVSVLKPLHGAEPLLEAALASTCAQDYPAFQVVFGVQRADDPALQMVERLRQRFPAADLAVVVDPTPARVQPQVGNLINMLPAAKHECW